eukprot:UN15667
MSCCANKLDLFSYCPTAFEKTISFPDNFVFGVATSGVIAEKAGVKKQDYNRASLLAKKSRRTMV